MQIMTLLELNWKTSLIKNDNKNNVKNIMTEIN